jgi:hypothetical protein
MCNGINGSGQSPFEGRCEQGNESSVSIKGEFLDRIGNVSVNAVGCVTELLLRVLCCCHVQVVLSAITWRFSFRWLENSTMKTILL